MRKKTGTSVERAQTGTTDKPKVAPVAVLTLKHHS